MKKWFVLSIAVSVVLTMFLFVFSAAATETEREFWIERDFCTFIYKKPELIGDFRITKSQYAVIEDFSHEIYKLNFHEGEVGYIDKEIFDRMKKKPYEFILSFAEKAELGFEEEGLATRRRILQAKRIGNEALQKETEAIQKEAEALKEWEIKKARIIAKLKNNGIYEKKTLWLKYPTNGLPGLTEIKITGLDVILKNMDGASVLSILHINSGAGIGKLMFEDEQIENMPNYFYFKYPASKWGKKVLKAIKDGHVLIGMTKGQIHASLGFPSDINNTVGAWGGHEQWIYDGLYLYIENGILTSWQN